MLAGLKDTLRRWLRGMQRSGCYPVLLPHHRVTGDSVSTLNQPARAIAPALAKALELCDGTRTLAQAARASGCTRRELIAAQDDGLVVLWRSPVPARPPALDRQPHAIILSPHLDDAALSCGGRLLGDHTLLVVNIFSRGVWWRLPFGQEDTAAIQACRRAEETLVARLAEVAMIDLELPESMLRGRGYETVFTDSPDQRDAAAIASLSQSLLALAREHALAHWYIPLGVGGHIDHRIVRDAALEVLQQAGVKRSHLHLYEDLPYAAEGKTGDFGHKHPELSLTRDLLDIDDTIQWKLELLRAYWSQFTWSRIVALRRYAKLAGEGETVEVAYTVK